MCSYNEKNCYNKSIKEFAMENMLFLPVMVFVGMMFFTFLMLFSVKSFTERRALLKKIKGGSGASLLGDATGNSSVSDLHLPGMKQYFMRITSSFGHIIKPKKEEDLSRIHKSLLNIGYRGKNAVMIYFGAKFLCLIILPMAFFFCQFFIHRPLSTLHIMMIYVLLALGGLYIPTLWLRIKIAKRKDLILNGFPDALDMLVVCVEAGMGLDASIDRVGEEMKLSNKAISEEFKLYNRELKLGKTRRDALKNIALRTGLEDVNSLVTLLIQTDRFGTSIAQALRIHSDFMRTQRYQRAEEKAAKLALKLLFPLVFCIFPSLFLVLLGPGVIQAYRLSSGH